MRMKKTKILSLLPVLLLTLLIAVSCYDSADTAREMKLKQLDNILQTDPKRGLDSVMAVTDLYKDGLEYTRKRFDLIKYKAETLCGVTHKSDSTILALNKYIYLHSAGNTHEKMEVLYLTGTTYQEMRKNAQALTWFDEARRFAETNTLEREDSIALAGVFSRTAIIYHETQEWHSAYTAMRESFDIQESLRISDYNTYQRMGRFSFQVDSLAFAKTCFSQCMELMLKNDLKDSHANDYLGEQLSFYSETHDTCLAIQTLNVIKRLDAGTLNANLYTALGDYHYNITQATDSSAYYYLHAYHAVTDITQQAYICKQLSMLLHANGKDHEAFAFMAANYRFQDSINNITRTKKDVVITDALSSVNNTKLTHLQNNLEESWIRLFHAGFIVFMFFIVFAAALIIIVVKEWRKKYNTDMKTVSDKLNYVSKQHTDLSEKVKIDKQLRAESSTDISVLTTHLSVLSNDIDKKLEQESWDTIFNTVDKTYPNFRRQILDLCPTINNKDLVFIYLLKLGFKQADISRILKNAPSVINRRYHHIESMFNVSLDSLIHDFT